MGGEASLETVEPGIRALEQLADACGPIGLLGLLGLHEPRGLLVELGQLGLGPVFLGVLDFHHDDPT
ncbi:MAG: hypothetical protein RIF41_17625 [Polyangiaceae bacterium]